MVSIKILIKGKKVQDVYYRLFLLEKAMESGIEKIYITSINKNEIEVLAGDGEDNIKLFYKKIRSESPRKARVIKEEPYDGKISIPSIDRYFHFLMLEQLSRGVEEFAKAMHKNT